MLDPAELADRAQAALPQAQINLLPQQRQAGHSVRMLIAARS